MAGGSIEIYRSSIHGFRRTTPREVREIMLGAIAGDMVGSPYEGSPIKSTEFQLFTNRSVFTDDTVLTVAVADAITSEEEYTSSMKQIGRQYPRAGYGGLFYRWLFSRVSEPYNSWGNGAAMRVSPVGFAFDSPGDVLREAKKCAAVTHNHPEGIKGAQATALAVFLARTGESKEKIREEITRRFAYDLDRKLSHIRPGYTFDVSCHSSVPESIIAFLESHDFESALRNAVSLGGDSDTMACIAGGIAQAFYRDMGPEIVRNTRQRLPEDLLRIVDSFNERFDIVC